MQRLCPIFVSKLVVMATLILGLSACRATANGGAKVTAPAGEEMVLEWSCATPPNVDAVFSVVATKDKEQQRARLQLTETTGSTITYAAERRVTPPRRG